MPGVGVTNVIVGAVVSMVTVLVSLTPRLPTLSFPYTLYVYVPSESPVLFSYQLVELREDMDSFVPFHSSVEELRSSSEVMLM